MLVAAVCREKATRLYFHLSLQEVGGEGRGGGGSTARPGRDLGTEVT